MWELKYKIGITCTTTEPVARDSGQHSPCHLGKVNTPRTHRRQPSSEHPEAQ